MGKRKTPEQKLEELKEQKAQLTARINKTQAQVKAQERKRDTRRKIIAGAIVLEHAKMNSDFNNDLMELLNKHIKRPEDRKLFNF